MRTSTYSDNQKIEKEEVKQYTEVHFMLLKSNQFYYLNHLLSEMDQFKTKLFLRYMLILDYLKSELESKSALPIAQFSGYHCRIPDTRDSSHELQLKPQ